MEERKRQCECEIYYSDRAVRERIFNTMFDKLGYLDLKIIEEIFDFIVTGSIIFEPDSKSEQ